MTRSTFKMVSMLMVAVFAAGTVVGCAEWRDAEPRKPASESSYKGSSNVKGQQWNASDGSSGTMSEPGQPAPPPPPAPPPGPQPAERY